MFQQHPFYLCDRELFDLYQLYLSSKWNLEMDVMQNMLPRIMYCWNVSYMSLRQIKFNKRLFGFTVMQIARVYNDENNNSEKSICCKLVCGKPNGERLIKELLQLMAVWNIDQMDVYCLENKK